MTDEERTLALDYLEKMQKTYVDGEGYEAHPLPEWYALETAIKALEQQPCEDCISRQKALDCFEQTNTRQGAKYAIETLPPVTPKYTDEEIDKAQAVEQAYVDKMVELAVEELRREWLNSFDTSSATKCFEAVNLLKERLRDE